MNSKSQSKIIELLNSRLSKPFALLKTFSTEELQNFERLIGSKYLTDNDITYSLLKLLQMYALPKSGNFDPYLVLKSLPKYSLANIKISDFDLLLRSLQQYTFANVAKVERDFLIELLQKYILPKRDKFDCDLLLKNLPKYTLPYINKSLPDLVLKSLPKYTLCNIVKFNQDFIIEFLKKKTSPNKSDKLELDLMLEKLPKFSLPKTNKFKLDLILENLQRCAISYSNILDPLIILKSLNKFSISDSDKFKLTILLDKFTPVLQMMVYKNLFIDENIKFNILTDYQTKKLNREMNILLDFAETFLKFEATKKTDEFDIELLLCELSKRDQMSLHEKHLKNKENKLLTQDKRGVDYYNQRLKIEIEKNRLLCVNYKIIKEDNYDEVQKYLDTKYLLEKLQYHLAKISLRKRYSGKDFNLKPFKTLRALFELPEYESNVLIKLYTLNINLLETEDKIIFDKLLKLLKQEQEKIPKDFLNPFYTNLANFCTHQIAKGDLKYYDYMFEIYNHMDKADLVIINKIIDISLLKNIITIACRVKNFDWAFERLKYYKKFIPKKNRKSVFEYNFGIIAFNQEKYDLALTHFSKVEKIDDIHDLNLRIVRLKCYYEIDLEHSTKTEVQITSLKAYIKNQQKLTRDQKTAYFNFIYIFNKLYNFKKIENKRSFKSLIKETLPRLKRQFSEFKLIREKLWLQNKLNTLEETIE